MARKRKIKIHAPLKQDIELYRRMKKMILYLLRIVNPQFPILIILKN